MAGWWCSPTRNGRSSSLSPEPRVPARVGRGYVPDARIATTPSCRRCGADLTQRALEQRQRALPGLLRRSGVVARRGVVVETVLGTGGLVHGVVHLRSLQCGFVGWPGRIDAFVG